MPIPNNKSNIGTCDYHLCRKRAEVHKCEFCGEYFCEEHINAKPPGMPRFKSTRQEDRLFMEEWHKPGGHPCAPFVSYWETEHKEKAEEYRYALDILLRSEPLADKSVPTISIEEVRAKEPTEPEPTEPTIATGERPKENHRVLFKLLLGVSIVLLLLFALLQSPALYKRTLETMKPYLYGIKGSKGLITTEPPPPMTTPPPTTAAILTTTLPPTTAPPTTTPVPITIAPPTTTPPPTTTAPPPALEIIEQSFTSDPNGKGILSGIVKNNAELTFTNVQIEGIFYDENESIVETKKSYPVGDVEPGQVKSFDIRPDKLIYFTDHYEIVIHYSNEIPQPPKPTTQPLPSPTPTIPPTHPPSTPQPRYFSQPGTPTYDIVELEKQIHNLINKERQVHGLSTLDWNDRLNIIAVKYSQDMAETNYFGHYSPEGYDFSDRYEQEGFDCRVETEGNYYYTGSENLFLGALYDSITYTTYMGVTTTSYNWMTQEEIAEDAVQGWMSSPGHRENILTPEWKTEGIGVAITDNYKVYATENFC